MDCAEHEPITGSGGRALSGVQGQSPGHGVRGRSPPEAGSILVIRCPTEPANLAPFQNLSYQKQCALLPSTGVRVGRAQNAWCPQPRHWGSCAPPRLGRLCSLLSPEPMEADECVGDVV